ncbi:MAG TPA: FecR domain-containing protein [Polyangiaceae bacterium]
MSEEFPRDPESLLRRMANQVVPVESAEQAESRRGKLVAELARSIRRGVEQRGRVRRVRALFATLGVGLAAAAGLAITLRVKDAPHTPNAPAGAMVAEVSGAVLVTDGGDSHVLRDGSNWLLHGTGEIETVADARADVRTQKSLVHIGTASKVLVPAATPSEERYRLMLGTVDVSVDKDARSSRAVVVETPNAEVLVRGTVFAVGVAAQASHVVTVVSVVRGSVWVLKGGVQVAVLGPGQRWSSEPQAVNDPAQRDAPSAPSAPALGGETAALEPRAAKQAEPIAQAKSGTLADENRSFQDALDARNRGDDARAAESFARLVARYPHSSLAEEAEVERFRALKRLGQTAPAAAAARRYLAAYPVGFARDEARAVALSAAEQSR